MKIRVIVAGVLVVFLNTSPSVINNLGKVLKKGAENAATGLRNSIRFDKLNDFGRKTAHERWQPITPHEVLKNPSPLEAIQAVKSNFKKGLQNPDLSVTDQELLQDALREANVNLFKLHTANALDTSFSEWSQRIKNFAINSEFKEKAAEFTQILAKDFATVINGFNSFIKNLFGFSFRDFSPELKKIKITSSSVEQKKRLQTVARKAGIAIAGGAAAYGAYEYLTGEDDFDDQELDDFESDFIPEPPISSMVNEDKITQDSSIISDSQLVENNQPLTTPIPVSQEVSIQPSYFNNIGQVWGALAGLTGLAATVGLVYKYFFNFSPKDKHKKELFASIKILQEEIVVLEKYLKEEAVLLLPDKGFKLKQVLARKRLILKKLYKELNTK